MGGVDWQGGNGIRLNRLFHECSVLIPSLSNRLFIMDGVISLPIAFAGYYFIPDLPTNCKARYLKPEVS